MRCCRNSGFCSVLLKGVGAQLRLFGVVDLAGLLPGPLRCPLAAAVCAADWSWGDRQEPALGARLRAHAERGQESYAGFAVPLPGTVLSGFPSRFPAAGVHQHSDLWLSELVRLGALPELQLLFSLVRPRPAAQELTRACLTSKLRPPPGVSCVWLCRFIVLYAFSRAYAYLQNIALTTQLLLNGELPVFCNPGVVVSVDHGSKKE